MGGGGAIRAAAKVADIGLQRAGVRGGLPENIGSARTAIRQSASAFSSTASVDDSSRVEFTAVSQTAPPLTWELDDWEFDGFGLEEPPRLVFGPAPSLEETKQATSELRDALDMMYLSPSDSVSAVDCRSVVPKPDSKHCVPDHTLAAPLVSNQALNAFKLLKENSSVQKVVSSIAADPKVWDAVLQNADLNQFMQSEKERESYELATVIQGEAKSENSVTESSESPTFIPGAGKSENAIFIAFKNVRHAVAGLMNNLSGYFQDLFGGPDEKPSSDGTLPSNSATVTASLFGLAVMVIMVVVLKRV